MRNQNLPRVRHDIATEHAKQFPAALDFKKNWKTTKKKRLKISEQTEEVPID